MSLNVLKVSHTFTAAVGGVSLLRFSSVSAPESSVSNRDVNHGRIEECPLMQIVCNKLLPKWSVKFRIIVGSSPSKHDS